MNSDQPIRIVLIEDNPPDARLIHELLRESGENWFELRHFERLESGLRALQKTPADVVLLDLSLPDSRGEQTFMRANRQAPQTPVIVLTHLNDQENAIQTLHEGAQDYLLKGEVDGQLLSRAIHYAIERKAVETKLEHYAEELRQRNAQLLDDLNMAREVQQALLPQSFPVLPAGCAPAEAAVQFSHRYRPSAAVGGDFFSVDYLGTHAAGLFICEVMGHGIRAALVTAIIRGLLEKSRAAATDPGLFLTEINKSLSAIFRKTGQLIFASAAYLVYDCERQMVWYANAGHPPPLQIHGDSGQVTRLLLNGENHDPGLGLFPEASYSTASQAVAGGDTLLLYTDGLTEVTNAAGEEFGEARLLGALQKGPYDTLDGLLDTALQAIEQFAAGGFADDICLLAAAIR
jgi:serine phosphatase RsbU (regulator of sigma subunit)